LEDEELRLSQQLQRVEEERVNLLQRLKGVKEEIQKLRRENDRQRITGVNNEESESQIHGL
jgi:hypothetical protein